MRIKLFLLFLSVVMIFGCARYHIPLETADKAEEAKKFTTSFNYANLYIYRIDSASSHLYQVVIDGKLIGSLETATFMLLRLPEGSHSIVAISQESQDIQNYNLSANKNYFIEIDRKMGINAPRPHLLQHGDSKEQRYIIANCEMAKLY